MPGAKTLTAGGHTVILTRRANAKNLILRVNEKQNAFALTAPTHTPLSEITHFLAENRAWMDRMAAARLMDWQPEYAPGERHLMLGRRVTLGEDGIPSGRAFLTARQRALEALIRQLIPVWEARMGVRASVVRFRNMRSRWGSCLSKTREIHLSTMLAAVPPHLVEYIVVHELTHLLHANHSPAFHAAMTRFLPDWPKRKREINKFDRRPWPSEK